MTSTEHFPNVMHFLGFIQTNFLHRPSFEHLVNISGVTKEVLATELAMQLVINVVKIRHVSKYVPILFLFVAISAVLEEIIDTVLFKPFVFLIEIIAGMFFATGMLKSGHAWKKNEEHGGVRCI